MVRAITCVSSYLTIGVLIFDNSTIMIISIILWILYSIHLRSTHFIISTFVPLTALPMHPIHNNYAHIIIILLCISIIRYVYKCLSSFHMRSNCVITAAKSVPQNGSTGRQRQQLTYQREVPDTLLETKTMAGELEDLER